MTKSKYYKHPKFGHVYGQDIKVPDSRVTWPYLVTPKPLKEGFEGQPRFELTFLLPKTDPKVEAFLATMKAMSQEMVELFNKGRPTSIAINTILGDGDAPYEGFDKDAYPYYAGNWTLVARNAELPTIVGANKENLDPAFIKSGMKCRAIVTPMVTSHGMSYKLGILQFLEDDGTRWGGQRDLKSMLDDETPPAPTAKKALTGKQAALDKL